MFCTSTWTWILYCDALSLSANPRFFSAPLVQLVGELETKQFEKINARFVSWFLLCGENKIFCNFLKCSRWTDRPEDDSQNVILSSIQVKLLDCRLQEEFQERKSFAQMLKSEAIDWMKCLCFLPSYNILLWHYIIYPHMHPHEPCWTLHSGHSVVTFTQVVVVLANGCGAIVSAVRCTRYNV